MCYSLKAFICDVTASFSPNEFFHDIINFMLINVFADGKRLLILLHMAYEG